MKKTIFVVCIICFSSKVFAQTAFTFSGEIIGGKNTFALLTYVNYQGKNVRDSCFLLNDNFYFKGDVNGGILASFSVYSDSVKLKSKNDLNTTSFFLEPGTITATGNYNHLKQLALNGSKSQVEYEMIQSRFTEFSNGYSSFSINFNKVNYDYETAKKNNKDDKVLDSIYKNLKPLQQQREVYAAKYEDIVRQFVITHPSSFVSPYEMRVYASSWPLDSVKKIYNQFTPSIQSSYYGKEIQKSIAAIDNNSINRKAFDFISTDLNGKPIRLSDFKGRYILLDFWASWCVPCRASTPHLIQLFKKYNKAGLEVIAVADDDNNHGAWKKAVKKDGTQIWHNILRGLIRNNMAFDRSKSISDQFAVSLLPTKILIDKDGVIIGRYTGTEETADLDKKLAEVFH